MALLVWQETETLPQVAAEDDTPVLDVLTVERGRAMEEVTRLRNQLHELLLQLDPEYRTRLPGLRRAAGVAALEAYTSPSTRELDQARAAAVRRIAQRLRLALTQAEEVAAQLRARARRHAAPLTRLCGVDLLTAGALAGLLGPGRRFRTDAQLAAYAGVAPLEASSAGCVRHRLNRGGNRRLNAVLHRIAVVQLRASPTTQAYVARRQAEGKSRREAVRALKRFLARAIWRLWQECTPEGAELAKAPPAPRPNVLDLAPEQAAA